MVTWLRHLHLNVVKLENEEWQKLKWDNLIIKVLYTVCVILGYQVWQNYLSSFFLISTFYFPIISFIFSIPKFPKFPHLATPYHTLFFCLCTTMEEKNDGTVNTIWVKLATFLSPSLTNIEFWAITLFTSLQTLISQKLSCLQSISYQYLTTK